MTATINLHGPYTFASYALPSTGVVLGITTPGAKTSLVCYDRGELGELVKAALAARDLLPAAPEGGEDQ